ncbi:MAG: hypothetical protein HKO57_13885 [Akkermansiaceae bacterium]|nr:hypothetical protein [Akkermansiaceae bacterium]
MTIKSAGWVVAALAVTVGTAAAQSRKISLRTLCFQHVDGLREVLLVSGSPEKPKLIPVELFTSTYSEPVVASIAGDVLRFAVEVTGADGEKQLKTVAQGKLAAGARQVAVFLPSEKPGIPYRLTVIDETEKNFPMGSTLIYNLTGTKARFLIGEHRKEIGPASLGLVPLPTEVNELSQCTVRVGLLGPDGKWIPVSSTAWRVSEEMRSFALAYIHPRTRQPVVNCLQETPPWRLPQFE